MQPDETSRITPIGTQESPAGATGPGLARTLGLFDITMLVMGSIIGTGIFKVPHDIAELVSSPLLILAAWVVGGLVTLAGSFVYAEWMRRRPYVGGQYAYLREAYHPALAFVYGWSLLWVVQSGGMAAVAVIFAKYFLEIMQIFAQWLGGSGNNETLVNAVTSFVSWPFAKATISTVAIGALTLLNCTGVRTGSTAQNIFMILKILAITMLVVCGLLFVDGIWSTNLLDGTDQKLNTVTDPSNAGNGWQITAFIAAMVPVFFAYGGAHTTTFMGGEVRNPRRDFPRGLVLGVSGVVALYLAVNYVCLRVLGREQLALTETPASDVMQRALGSPGAALIALGIAISALGFLSQATLTSPRVYYAMAKDGLFFRIVAWIHPHTRVPVVAILLQGLFAIVIAASGTFWQILNYVMSVELIFLSLTVLGLFIIRKRDACMVDSASLNMPGHPITTLSYACINLAVVVNLFFKEPVNCCIAIAIALASLPVYLAWRIVGGLSKTTVDRADPEKA